MQARSTELRALADELKEAYHDLLALAKEAHAEARGAGKQHDVDSRHKQGRLDSLYDELGGSMQSPPQRWKDMYVDQIWLTWPELPPLAGRESYVQSDRWMLGLVDTGGTTGSRGASRGPSIHSGNIRIMPLSDYADQMRLLFINLQTLSHHIVTSVPVKFRQRRLRGDAGVLRGCACSASFVKVSAEQKCRRG